MVGMHGRIFYYEKDLLNSRLKPLKCQSFNQMFPPRYTSIHPRIAPLSSMCAMYKLQPFLRVVSPGHQGVFVSKRHCLIGRRLGDSTRARITPAGIRSHPTKVCMHDLFRMGGRCLHQYYGCEHPFSGGL